MKRRKGKIIKVKRTKIIKDPKLRGEWAESVFVARANEEGLAVSRPWGDSKSYDFVVGKPGRFVGVQVKSTTFEMGGGYSCAVKHNNQAYARGAFDFVAAYVIPEDVWYIVPAEKLRKRATMIIGSDSKQAMYEEYREAWHLLREAAREGEESEDPLLAASARSGVPGGREGSTKELARCGGERGVTAGEVKPAWQPPGNALERVRAAMEFARRQLGMGGERAHEEDEG